MKDLIPAVRVLLSEYFREEAPFLSLQYWHQGLGETYTQSMIGPSYVFRAKKLLTFQAGIGYPLEQGPAWPEDIEQAPIMLLYAIGLYFPI